MFSDGPSVCPCECGRHRCMCCCEHNIINNNNNNNTTIFKVPGHGK